MPAVTKKALNGIVAGASIRDGLGRRINTTYATKGELTASEEAALRALYNLGAYDTYVDNGNGTTTITRQTGYITLDGRETWTLVGTYDSCFSAKAAFADDYLKVSSSEMPLITLNRSKFSPVAQGSFYNTTGKITVDSSSQTTTNVYVTLSNTYVASASSVAQELAYRPLHIQYKLATARTETVASKRSLSQLDVSGERYLEGLYDKSKNLFDMDSMRQFYYITAEDGECLNDPNYDYEYGSDAYIPVNSPRINFTFDTRPNSNYLEYAQRFYRVGCYTETGSFISRLSGVPNAATVSLSLPSGTKYIRLSVNTPSASSYRFMLVEGPSALPYVSFDASAHLENKEAKLVKENYKKTTNLFDSSRVYNYASYPVNAFTVGEGSVSITDRGQYPYNRVCFDIPNAKNKTFSFKATVPYNTQVYIYQKDSSNTTLQNQHRYISGSTLTFTPTADVACVCFYAYNPDDPWGTASSSYKVITFSNIMINEGSKALPYQPYDASGHITHPEAKLLLDEYQKSANLANKVTSVYTGTTPYHINVTETLEGLGSGKQVMALSATGTYSRCMFMVANDLEIGKIYTFSCSSTTSDGAFTGRCSSTGTSIDDGDYGIIYLENGVRTLTFTAVAKTFYIGIYLTVSSTSSRNATVTDFMICEGSKYVPYQHPHGKIVHENDTKVLLWKNDNPNNTFSASNWDIADSSAFKYLVFAIKNTNGDSIVTEMQKVENSVGKYIPLASVDEFGRKTRTAQIVSNTIIKLVDGREDGTLDNTACIPVAIYGTNVL